MGTHSHNKRGQPSGLARGKFLCHTLPTIPRSALSPFHLVYPTAPCAYTEKYLQSVWPVISQGCKQHGIKAELNLVTLQGMSIEVEQIYACVDRRPHESENNAEDFRSLHHHQSTRYAEALGKKCPCQSGKPRCTKAATRTTETHVGSQDP